MQSTFICFFLALANIVHDIVAFNINLPPRRFTCAAFRLKQVQRDAQGYEVKPRDWFNGLSSDPGASLTDSRAVPPACKEFAEKIKSGEATVTFQDTMNLINEHYQYFEVPYTCGTNSYEPNIMTGSAKVFSFGLMTRMNEEQTLRLFGEIFRDLKPDGSDHANIRTFMKEGWPSVTFPSGLAIVSKLQAYDDTDSAMATQAVLEGEGDWDEDSDSWIP